MVKKMLALMTLLPAVGGCIWHDGDGRGRRGEHHEHHGAVVVSPVHVHGVGCGHVLRVGVWVNAD